MLNRNGNNSPFYLPQRGSKKDFSIILSNFSEKDSCRAVVFLFIWFFNFYFLSETLSAKNIHVGAHQKIRTIQSALKIISNGDSVIVEEGTYKEKSLLIDKSIILIGKNSPVLSGENKYEIMKIKADNVVVKGFIFKDTGLNFIFDNAAIKLDSVTNCTIEKNIFVNNFFGIYLSRSSRCKIIGNELSASQTKETYSGNGIHLWQCREMIIQKNKIEGHRDGIYFEFVKASTIEENKSENNLRYGLHFMFSDSCKYSGNFFKKNGAGVAVMFTRNVDMHNNRFEYNWGGAAYGLLLKDISDSRIFENDFVKNSCAIYYEGCSRVTTHNNNLTENGTAIRLMANSMDNSFSYNNFIGNSFDVTTNSTRNYNSFENNYWSEYKGYDLNKDGIGDIPHRPVKLFSIIIERNRPSLILIRSLFVELLNAAENIFPSLTPQTLIDSKPQMKRYL
ncbi:MAG: nitrous oxide reductase family maturation protein NosD [Ignavibacteriales bacterium]|nr:nitrous oxide reductase family maturation protein NosD [Ignavibacteriales bacterium]